jgi:hypothetical protein
MNPQPAPGVIIPSATGGVRSPAAKQRMMITFLPAFG